MLVGDVQAFPEAFLQHLGEVDIRLDGHFVEPARDSQILGHSQKRSTICSSFSYRTYLLTLLLE